MRAWYAKFAIGAVLVPSLAAAQPDDGRKAERTGPAMPTSPRRHRIPSPTTTPASTTAIVTGTVDAPELEAPLAGATVKVVGTTIETVTDAEGKYTLDVPPGKITLRIEFAGFKTVEQEVVALLGPPVEANASMSPDAGLNEVVVVVGSRTPRTNVETPVAVDVVTAEESLPQRSQRDRPDPRQARAVVHLDAADDSRTAPITSTRRRSAASVPIRCSLLVNGKRRHKSALLNVNGNVRSRHGRHRSQTRSPPDRSSGSRSCATAPRRSTAPTRSRA